MINTISFKTLRIVFIAFLVSMIGSFFICSLLFIAYSFYPEFFVSANSPIQLWHFSILIIISYLLIFGIIVDRSLKQKEPLTDRKKVFYALSVLSLFIIGIIIIISVDVYNPSRLQILANTIEPKVKEHENRKFIRPVLRGTPISGNGADVYLRIIGKNNDKAAFDLFNKDDIKNLQDKDGNIKPVPDIIKKYQKQIDIIRQGTQHEYINPPLQLTLDFKFPNYIMALNMSKIMIAAAIEKCRQGKYKEGTDLFFDTLRFGQDMSSFGLLIGTMIGVSIDNTATKSFAKYLTDKHISLNDYKSSLLQMENFLNSAIDIKSSFMDEFLLQQNGFLTVLKKKENILDFATVRPSVISQLILKPIIIDAIPKTSMIMKPIIEMADMEYYQKKQNLKVKDIEKIAQSNIFTSISTPNFIAVIEKSIMAQAIINGLYINIALEAYYTQNHKYPDSLESLKPAIVKYLPLDPFSGKSFIYKLKNPNHYVLYSIGKNQIDDEGKDKHYSETGEKSDIVF